MSGTLYVVATPIGNLEDITFRAVRVLREVAIIAAEDTRRTARLLQHYSISTRTTSLHEHNERARIPALLDRLGSGQSVAMVSDAGTPLISDPGALLVSAAHAAGIRVEPVPGPSAALAVISASGFQGTEILFLGFPPRRSKARKNLFLTLAHDGRLGVFFEAPHRIRASLEDLAVVVGPRLIAVGREVTKLHEELVVRPIKEALQQLGTPRGEYTVVVAPGVEVPIAAVELPGGKALRSEFGEMTKGARSRRDAVRTLAVKYHLPVREMYHLLEAGGDE